MSLGTRIVEAREQMDISQAALGKLVHAAQSTVASWEVGKREPDLSTIKRLAKVLQRTPEWLAFAINADINERLALIPEIDVRASSGPPGMLEIAHSGGEDIVLRKYGFPEQEFRALFGSSANHVVVVEVVGDSMLPTLRPGEKVLIDTEDKRPSPPGIFVVWDGLGLVIKRVEFVAHSDPARVRIISDNDHYEVYERLVGEAYIQGRVIGSWQRR